MKKNILLIRTFIPTGIGGPVPPLESLYIFSQIVENCISSYNLKIIDMGIGALSLEDVSEIITDCKPSFIIFQSLAWEAEIVHRLASFSKKLNKHISTIVTSQLAFTAQEFLLTDTNIDFVLYGEADLTIPTLLNTLDSKSDLSSVEGIIFREEGNTIKTTLAKAPSNLDDINISSEAWDSIDVKAYSKYSNWNGSIKEDFYIPILSSRGCPFTCEYCRDNCSKQFIPRSPENVISEIKFLNEKYGAKEFHFFDSVFNYDIARAKRICELIIDSKMNLSLAFPHGLRADLMTDELIDLLKKAGTYKLVYGIETASQRLQHEIKKNLDINKVNEIISKTSNKGIIVGGYFMLGFPSEKEKEMNETINFAVNSDLDIASFFKVTSYDEIVDIYKNMQQKGDFTNISQDFKDLGYYSDKRSLSILSPKKLNIQIIKAQRKFYLNTKRIIRGFKKYPKKTAYLKNLFFAFGLILQGFIMENLSKESTDSNS